MTIGAVSSYSYSSSVQYQFFGANVSNQRLQDLLAKYGIKPTGDSSADLQALYQAIYSEAQSEVAGTTANSQPQGVNSQSKDADASVDVPWASLMTQIGLPTTGNLETDYEAFNGRINTMQQAASSGTNEVNSLINQLNSEADIVFIQQRPPATSSSQPAQGAQSQVTGADIMAQLNRMYLVG